MTHHVKLGNKIKQQQCNNEDLNKSQNGPLLVVIAATRVTSIRPNRSTATKYIRVSVFGPVRITKGASKMVPEAVLLFQQIPLLKTLDKLLAHPRFKDWIVSFSRGYS